MRCKPKVSIIMPVYNGELYLKEAIDSIFKQSFTDYEFIVIDDGSTDRSAEIIGNYHDPRLQVITLPKNRGLSVALNVGLEVANGMYIARMDCDDLSHPARLEKEVKFLDEHPD